VNGYLSEVPFKSGSEVKKGDLLFVIDERPYKATLDRAEGEIKLAEAKHKFDLAEVKTKRAAGEVRGDDSVGVRQNGGRPAINRRLPIDAAKGRHPNRPGSI